MKNNRFVQIKLFAILILSFVFFSSIFGFFISKKTVLAQASSYSANFFLPATAVEYYELSSPLDVFMDEEITAITQKNDLLLFKDGEWNTSSIFTDLKQVYKLDSNTLLVSDYNAVCKIALSDLTSKTNVFYKNGNNDETIGAVFFDLNDSHLVTASNSFIYVYEIVDGEFTNRKPIENASDKPVAINDKGEVYFINNNGNLCRSLVDKTDTTSTIEYSVNANYMIANNDYLYYIEDKQIYRYSIADQTTTLLTVDTDGKYELGQLKSPRSIDFYNGNLLITDSELNAVQEFRINGNNLIFTGFAIAKDKTAYNRFENSVVNVEKYGDKVAVLDKTELSIVDTNTNNRYEKNNFINIPLSSSGAVDSNINTFALGAESFLYCNKDHKVKLVEFSSLESATEIYLQSNSKFFIDSLCYQSGTYYVLAYTGENSIVYSFPEKIEDESQRVANQILSVPADNFKFIAADVFKNVYLANDSEIYKYPIINGQVSPQDSVKVVSSTGIKKISTDLSATLFVLDVNGLNAYNDTDKSLNTLNVETFDANITTFAMDFIDKTVYLAFENEEYVKTVTDLPNVALESLTIDAQEFVTTSNSANFEKLKIYKPKANANVYSVNKLTQNFEFNHLTNQNGEYVLICPINVSSDYANTTFYALAGQDGFVLINSNDIIDATPTMDIKIGKAFTTTGVHAYYIPLIVKNDLYSLSNEGRKIRLEKATEISTEKIFTYLGREYYYAKIDIDGTSCYGYVPVAFTTPVLSENFKWDEYTIENVKDCTLYENKELSEVLTSLTNDQSVRLIQIDGDVAFVAVKTEDGFIHGYISVSAIQNKPNVAIRNALLILAVAASACGTTTYLVLKRREK